MGFEGRKVRFKFMYLHNYEFLQVRQSFFLGLPLYYRKERKEKERKEIVICISRFVVLFLDI